MQPLSISRYRWLPMTMPSTVCPLQVHASIARLSIQPTTAEEFAEYLDFQAQLEVDQKQYTYEYDEVGAGLQMGCMSMTR